MPELHLETTPPSAVRNAPLPKTGRVLWTLRADYPAPNGTAYLRAVRVGDDGDAVLDVLTPAGVLLQRAPVSGFDRPPAVCVRTCCPPVYRETVDRSCAA